MERSPQIPPRTLQPQDTPRPAAKPVARTGAGTGARPGDATGSSNASSYDRILPSLMAIGFTLMLVLPMLAAWLLRSAEAVAQQTKNPVDLTCRTDAFVLAIFGGWGAIVYVWACCKFSQSKGKSWTWGLLGLPAILAFVCEAWFGSPAFGFLCVLGVGGFAAPLLLPVDRVLRPAKSTSPISAGLAKLVGEAGWVWALGLFIGVSIAYGNSFRGGMTLDNKYIIEEYFRAVPKIVPGGDLYSWTAMVPLFFQNDYWWPKGISGLYRPVAALSYWMNYATNHALGNDPLDPFQYHVVNFFLHWIAACLGFVMIRQISGRLSLAFFAALLFAMHPIATESVSNIIGRSDILAAITVFGCMALYIRSTRNEPWHLAPWLTLFVTIELLVILFLAAAPAFSTPKWLVYTGVLALFAVPVLGVLAVLQSRRRQWTRFPWLAAMLAVLTVGLFSKESAIAVGALIVVYDAIYRWTLDDFHRAVPSLLLFSLLSALLAVVGLEIGQFGALGLSEGLTPVLVIVLVGSLLVAGGLVLVRTFWAAGEPLSFSQMLAPWTKFFLPYAMVIPPALLWLAARRWVFANSSPPETPFLDNPIRGLGFLAARMTASDVFLRMIGLLAWPARLSADYSFNQIPLFYGHLGSAETWLAMMGLLVLLAIGAWIVVSWKANKLVCFLLFFYLIAYLPTSNFLIIIGSIMAERFLYLPLIGFTALLVMGVESMVGRFTSDSGNAAAFWPFRSAIVGSVLGAMALACGLRARFRNDDWISDITLWTAAAVDSPNSFRSYQSKAFALYERLQSREASGVYANDPGLRDQDVDACYQTAEHAKPIVDPLPLAENSSRLYLHLGMYYSAKGQEVGHFQPNGTLAPGDGGEIWFRKAEKVLQEGVAIDRTFDEINRTKELARKIHKPSEIADVGLPPIYSTLGGAYARLGEWDKAIATFKYMRHLEPVDADAYVGLATCYSNQGRPEQEAIALFQAILLDNKRTGLWSALGQSLSALSHGGDPPLTATPDGKLQIRTDIPQVRSVLCSAYQGLFRIFTLARRPAIANQFRTAAQNQWSFSSDLFDGLVTDPDAEAPQPPPPD